MIIQPPDQEPQDELRDSDIWGDSEDEFPQRTHEETSDMNTGNDNHDEDFYGVRPAVPESAEIAALRRVHAKQGYLAGISYQKEESLQKGFDDGYPIGADLGIKVGEILGKLQVLSYDSNPAICEHATELLQQAQEELHIRKVLNKKYFETQTLSIESHPLITHWNEQVNSLLHQASELHR